MPKKVKTMNAAPNYQPGAPPAWQPPPGSAAAAFTGAAGGQVQFGPPPPQGPRNPFLNAQWLWANGNSNDPGRSVQGTIVGVRQAVGGNAAIQSRPGFFLDVKLTSGLAITARISIGDTRHAKLWAKFGPNLVNQRVTFRLSNPGDNTKAPWTVD